MNIKSIADARRAGFKVQVNHFRFANKEVEAIRGSGLVKSRDQANYAKQIGVEPIHASSFQDGREISALGGVTEVILEKDGAQYLGAAHCALVDNYNKNFGINRALGRALSAVKHNICI